MIELHKLLIKFRIIHVAVTCFFLWLGWDAWSWYKNNHSLLSEAGTAGFGVIFIAIIGALKYILETVNKNREHD